MPDLIEGGEANSQINKMLSFPTVLSSQEKFLDTFSISSAIVKGILKRDIELSKQVYLRERVVAKVRVFLLKVEQFSIFRASFEFYPTSYQKESKLGFPPNSTPRMRETQFPLSQLNSFAPVTYQQIEILR